MILLAEENNSLQLFSYWKILTSCEYSHTEWLKKNNIKKKLRKKKLAAKIKYARKDSEKITRRYSICITYSMVRKCVKKRISSVKKNRKCDKKLNLLQKDWLAK